MLYVNAIGITALSVDQFQSLTRTCAICVPLAIGEGCCGDSNEKQDTGKVVVVFLRPTMVFLSCGRCVSTIVHSLYSLVLT